LPAFVKSLPRRLRAAALSKCTAPVRAPAPPCATAAVETTPTGTPAAAPTPVASRASPATSLQHLIVLLPSQATVAAASPMAWPTLVRKASGVRERVLSW
jgi:hypothetical protein